LPFNNGLYDETLNKKLRIGIWKNTDGISENCPSTNWAIDEAAKALRKQGHEVVEFYYEWVDSAVLNFCFILLQMSTGDHAKEIKWQNERIDTSIQSFYTIFDSPAIVNNLASMLATNFGEIWTAKMMRSANQGTIDDFALALKLRQWQTSIFEKKWKELDLDGLLAPVFPTPAFKLSNQKEL
jgi:Asp-tRNA(Asn)/Glu-tRNA(Gln) amidotransferase A subunit family amidase